MKRFMRISYTSEFGKEFMEIHGIFMVINSWLVVEPYPFWKIWKSDDIPNIWKVIKNVPKHRPGFLYHFTHSWTIGHTDHFCVVWPWLYCWNLLNHLFWAQYSWPSYSLKIWANYNNSLTWIVRPFWDDSPNPNYDFQWGRTVRSL